MAVTPGGAGLEPVVWADETSPFTGPQVKALLDENEKLRDWITRICVLAGNANRRGSVDESFLSAVNIMRGRAIEQGFVSPGIVWDATPE